MASALKSSAAPPPPPLLVLVVAVLVGVTCSWQPHDDACASVCNCDRGAAWCDARNLTHVPFFPAATRAIYLQHNNVTSVGADDFPSLGNVTTLVLAHNALTALDGATFANLPRLETLDVANNAISRFPARMALPGRLKTLDADDNRIRTLEDFTFESLPELRVLSLADNELTTVGRYAFAGLKSLETLSLADNSLADLADDVFTYTPCLRDVDLSGNDFRSVPNLAGLVNLRALRMRANRLASVDLRGNFASARHLERVDFSGNNVSVVAGYAFRSVFATLRHLNLSDCDVRSVDRSALHLERLESLDLSGNERVAELPRALLVLQRTTIRSLRLSRVGIADVGAYHGVLHLTRMEQLQQLDLSHNRLQTFPGDTFQRMLKLRELDLGHNDLRVTGVHGGGGGGGGTMTMLPSLCTLRLNDNKLTAIPFIAHEKCDEYDPPPPGNDPPPAGSNPPPPVNDPPLRGTTSGGGVRCRALASLTHLDLSRNSIVALPRDQLRRVRSHPRLRTVDLSRNPLRCACDTRALCDWLQHGEVTFVAGNDTTCHHPAAERGTSLLDFCRRLAARPSDCDVDAGRRRTKRVVFGCVATVVIVGVVAASVLFAHIFLRTSQLRRVKMARQQQREYSEVERGSGGGGGGGGGSGRGTPVADQSTQDTFLNFDDSSSSQRSETDQGESDATC
ncbi:PREDICTED: leucine-rich repeat-containing G-protein coupled receptor 6-like [Priapulus caudatus]|uniref:Leucine-rich repeat-containing G-protein coupled receptor 6-like n=1 Tax=Priapulus caudatus TaxID=37621 RepID=A0ABM1DNQ7_PRICU|nr:PREDICTED: leucine-rich repeat-containing G-protein coupled receptor 6-like [Priapulus caudatus]